MVYLRTVFLLNICFKCVCMCVNFPPLAVVPSKNRMILISAQNVDPEMYPSVISHTPQRK